MNKILLFLTCIGFFASYAGDKQLFAALRTNNREQMKYLLSKGGNCDAYDCSGYGLLHWAVLANNMPMVKLLLEHGADVNAQGEYIALSISQLPKDFTQESYVTLKSIINFVYPCQQKGGYGMFINNYSKFMGIFHYHILPPTYLMIPDFAHKTNNNLRLIEQLNQSIVSSRETRVFHHLTPLHWALVTQNSDMIKLLLSHKANTALLCDVDYNDNMQVGLLEWAKILSTPEIVALLAEHEAFVKPKTVKKLAAYRLSKNFPLQRDKKLREAMVSALKTGINRTTIASFTSILSLGANPNIRGKNNSTILHKAAEIGNKELVRLLLDNKADVTVKDDDGNTPLHILIQSLIAKGTTIGTDNFITIAKMLLANRADVDAKNNEGLTPLACLLVNNISSLNISSTRSITVLDFYFKVCKCTPAMLLLLLSYGADFTVKNNVLLEAAYKCNCMPVVNLLLDHGAFLGSREETLSDFNKVSEYEDRHAINRALSANDTERVIAILNYTPAITKNREPLSVKEYIEFKLGSLGTSYSALELALTKYFNNLLEAINQDDYEFVRHALEQGFPITICDELGNSLLHRAVEAKSVTIRRLLLALKPSLLTKKNKLGITPLDLAV
ncbi:ankyrin repeat domain-containing protein [Candidatus Dependentiae bacterium]|nr:ankyrin repeat domain-containing protein [Candidatus Dependentiae bacterium]